MNRSTDVVSLAGGLVLLVVSGFFLLADDRSLEEVGRWLVPLVLIVGGATLLLGSLRRR